MINGASSLLNPEVRLGIEKLEGRGILEISRSDDDVEYDVAPTRTEDFLGVIDENSFLRECIRRSLQSTLPFSVRPYSNVKELQQDNEKGKAIVFMISCLDFDKNSCANALDELSEIDPRTPVIVLGHKSQFLSVAISHGAKGYIPLTMEFKVVVEAVRVVLAGGTYMPMACALSEQSSSPSKALTSRELSVVRAIQLGKSNKVIAYDLNMTESTVKVHVRHIMAKMKAKNRTEIAINAEKYIRNT